MPLNKPDQQHLRVAHGYIALGMFEEANAELEEIDPFCRYVPEVLTARVADVEKGARIVARAPTFAVSRSLQKNLIIQTLALRLQRE